MPSHLLQLGNVCSVAHLVGGELVAPEIRVRTRHGRFPTILVRMPEAAMHEDDGLVLRKDDVGGAGEVTAMETEAEANPVEQGADCSFKAGILAFDFCHQAASRLRVEFVHESWTTSLDGGTQGGFANILKSHCAFAP